MVAGGIFFWGGKQYAAPLGRSVALTPSPAASPARRWLPLLGGGFPYSAASHSPAVLLRPLVLWVITAASVSSLLLGSQSGVFSFRPIGKRVPHLLLIGRIEDQCFISEYSFTVVTHLGGIGAHLL